MTTYVTFSRQNVAGSRASTTKRLENLVLIVVVVIVLESKALYYNIHWLINLPILITYVLDNILDIVRKS